MSNDRERIAIEEAVKPSAFSVHLSPRVQSTLGFYPAQRGKRQLDNEREIARSREKQRKRELWFAYKKQIWNLLIRSTVIE